MRNTDARSEPVVLVERDHLDVVDVSDPVSVRVGA
jgi:hypothetical protein